MSQRDNESPSHPHQSREHFCLVSSTQSLILHTFYVSIVTDIYVEVTSLCYTLDMGLFFVPLLIDIDDYHFLLLIL